LARFYKGVEFGGWISLKTYEHIAKHLHVSCVALIASYTRRNQYLEQSQ